METAIPPEAQQHTGSTGSFTFLAQLVVRPRRAFLALAENRTRGWLLVLLLILALGLIKIVVAAPIQQRLIIESMRSITTLQESRPLPGPARGGEPTPPPIPPEAEQFVASPFFTIVTPALGLIFSTFISWLIWAGALHLLSVFLGGRSAFGLMFKAVIAADLPSALRHLLQTIYMAMTQQLIANPGLSGLVAPQPSMPSPEAISSGLSLSPGQIVLRQVLAGIDVFLIWRLFLLGVAVWTIARLTRRKAYGIVLGTWVLFTLLSLVPTLVSYSLMQGVVSGTP